MQSSHAIVSDIRPSTLGKWGWEFLFFEVRISPMLERAQLREETTVSVMTIDQHRIEVGASSVFNILEGFGGLPVIYTV